MNNENIALVVDSCTDIPADFAQEHNIYTVPLLVNYAHETYLDRVTIQPQEVYDRFSQEIPSTSTPTPASVASVLQQVVQDGHSKAVIVTISSGLSATYDLMRSAAAGTPGLDAVVVDTKNIGLGAGLTGMAAARFIEQGIPFCQLEEKLNQVVRDTRVFFCVDTLEYLHKGGRIGHVTYKMGSLLDVRPVISCNEDGVYYTVSKAKGRRQSLKKAVAEAAKFAAGFDRYKIGVVNGDAEAEASEVMATLKAKAPNFTESYTGQISPVLVVHTGPGLIGVGVQGIR